jgi:hypothetical protein
MGYARNIGRLGALAVALGVGYGVADMPVAFADTNGSADSSSSGARAHTRSASPAGGSDSSASSSSGSGRHGASSAPQAAASIKPSRVNNSSRASSAAAVVAPVQSAPAAVAAPPAAPAAATASVAVAAAAKAAPAASAPAVAPAAAIVQPGPVAAAAVPTTISAHPIAAKVGSLVAAALAPLLANGTGGAPGQSPLLFSVLAWARKEFDRLGFTPPSAGTTTAQTQSPNLLVNPGAEDSTPSGSGFSAVSMPGWTWTGTPTVIKYGTPKVLMPLGLAQPLPDLPAIWGFPTAKNGATNGGNQFFGGGNVADSSMSQTVDLSAASSNIDNGNVSYNLSGWLGGYSFDPSAASVKVTFLDSNKATLGTNSIGPVTAWQRLFAINLLERSTEGVLPTGTRYAKVDVTFDDKNPVKYGFAAGYNDAFADNISFTIGADLPAPGDPTPPVSKVGDLQHVYMVYMENKGYTNVVGSPDAPFLNGLINAYGFANNFFALTHGSLPNYYPMIGGDNYGITYNCATACIDVPKADTLVGQIEQAGLTWKSYAQSLAPGADPTVSSGDYAFDETGFPAFSFIGNDPAYAKQHIVPLEQMAIDLQSTATAPDYAWFAADEDNNGEGPTTFPVGALKFALNQLDPKHPYNVKALDQYLSETIPTIMNSNAWNSDESSVIVVTFDEDNNNLSLGFGNEGNHIVTVVIPNQAAIDAGMRAGHFLATDQYNLYSVLHMIEETLNLPGGLTQNDKFATPMNEFWT